MARSTDSADPTEPTDDPVDLDEADDPEFADGFEVFDPDDEQAELAGDDDAVADGDDVLDVDDSDEIEVDVTLALVDTQFDADDAVESSLDADGVLEDEVEGVRTTEFVCLGCYLAKRRTQLADKKRSLCVDCV